MNEEPIYLGIWNPEETNMEDFVLANTPHDGHWYEVRFRVKIESQAIKGEGK